MPPKSAHERAASQLNKLMSDPSKPAHIPAPPKEKHLRGPREMMKNVQGSSAGAGSGEFHVYKQSRRREYERLREMDKEEAADKAAKEAQMKQEAIESAAEAKLAKNRAKRQRRKKGRNTTASDTKDISDDAESEGDEAGHNKKRRLLGVEGTGVMFRAPDADLVGVVDRQEDDVVGEGQHEAIAPTFQVRAAPVQSNVSIVDDD